MELRHKTSKRNCHNLRAVFQLVKGSGTLLVMLFKDITKSREDTANILCDPAEILLGTIVQGCGKLFHMLTI